MVDRFEELARDSERLIMVREYVKQCMNEKYQVVDKATLCILLGVEYKEKGI